VASSARSESPTVPPIRTSNPTCWSRGLHRYLSHETDGLPTIDALIVEGDPKELELDEIEENLERRDLTVLERARAEKRQKELYLELRPETRAAVAGGRARQGHQAKHVSFAADSATSGSGRRMIEQRVQIATALGDDVFALLADTTIADNNHRQLCALARLPVRHRGPAAELIATGKAKTVDAAMQKVTGTPRPPAAAPRCRCKGSSRRRRDGTGGHALLSRAQGEGSAHQ
jgi:ParB family chromosome partitioning protein